MLFPAPLLIVAPSYRKSAVIGPWLAGIAVLVVTLLYASCAPARAGSTAKNQRPANTLIGMQYEVWFTPLNNGEWNTAEAIPLLGKYSSYEAKVLSQHAEWFEELGIDWILVDWSNMLWMEPRWEQHQGATQELENATDLLFNTYRQLWNEGRHPPKIGLLLGLQNGGPVADGMVRLNLMVDWITRRYLRAPEYRDLLLDYEGKPLLTILYNLDLADDPCRALKSHLQREQVVAPDWTVRWMSSQLQANHADRCGMWSWMDGPVRQVVVQNQNGAEQAVVTPASFYMPGGWLAPQATARKNGYSYIESWKVAFESRPKVIQLHQWNEFAGQKESEGYGAEHNLYGDEYNLNLSDDLEPTERNRCAYRGCGGWGYYYVNLTKALISLYRDETPDIAVMAVLAVPRTSDVRRPRFHLAWNLIGTKPTSYTIRLDGKVVSGEVRGLEYDLAFPEASTGKHLVTIVANGVHTYFDLTPDRLAQKSATPLPVTASVSLELRHSN